MLQGPVLLALNHALSQAAWARHRLQAFAGRSARLTAPPWHLVFVVSSDGLLETPRDDPEFDVELLLPVDTPLRLLRGREEIMRDVRIQGAADFADTLGFVLTRLSWDVEEDLAKLLGDVAAHRIVSGFGAFSAWQNQAVRNLLENISEYLTYEVPVVARAEQVRGFVGGVDSFANDLGRLEARLQRLSRA